MPKYLIACPSNEGGQMQFVHISDSNTYVLFFHQLILCLNFICVITVSGTQGNYDSNSPL